MNAVVVAAPSGAVREGARDLVRLAKLWRQPVVGGLFAGDRDAFHVVAVMVLVDAAGTVGFRDLMGRPIAAERAHGIELTIAEARALAT